MSRLAVFAFFLTFLLQAKAQPQLFSSGPPASATSPTADGRTHGVPASAVSPNPPPFVPGRNPIFFTGHPVTGRSLRTFGTPHRRQIFVPVPVFYPVYAGGYDSAYPSVADPNVPQATDATAAQSDASGAPAAASSEEALRAAYIQGVRDALAQEQSEGRAGQRFVDSHESPRAKTPVAESKPAVSASPDPKPAVDDSPATVFIFKDGHQIETRNFAIMGQTLYDFSSSDLRKVQLTDLDEAATVKANDDRGITVKLQ